MLAKRPKSAKCRERFAIFRPRFVSVYTAESISRSGSRKGGKEGEEVLVAVVWNSNLRTQRFTTSRHSAAHLEEANSSSDQTVGRLDPAESPFKRSFLPLLPSSTTRSSRVSSSPLTLWTSVSESRFPVSAQRSARSEAEEWKHEQGWLRMNVSGSMGTSREFSRVAAR